MLEDGTIATVEVYGFTELAFDGKKEKRVGEGERFCSDAVRLSLESGQYLCVELVYKGEVVPCHIESVLPVFTKTDKGWAYDKQMPLPGMIGCARPVKRKIAFFGDSITQGIGPAKNSYAHYTALVSEALGSDYAFWNIGIGFGRAQDGASDGAWLYKAKRNDLVVVCFGVNDILQGRTADELKSNLTTIALKLKESGVKVVLQTVPPFDYIPEKKAIWKSVNDYIKTELARAVDGVFDTVPVLRESEQNEQNAKYGGHPDEAGSRAWAEKLAPYLREILLTGKK